MDIQKNIYPDLARHGFGISSDTSTVRVDQLTYESPIHLWENSILYGPCSIGAYSYMNLFAMFFNVHIARFLLYCRLCEGGLGIMIPNFPPIPFGLI